jgi:hypothetical protein
MSHTQGEGLFGGTDFLSARQKIPLPYETQAIP